MALNINGTTGISGVDGSVSAPAITGTDSNTGITFPSADTIKFSTGGVERMAVSNSGVTGITQGITEVDQWGITTNQTSDTDPVTAFARVSGNGAASPLGTGMSVSSGIFTFPSTGKYLVYSKAKFSVNDSDSVAFNTLVTLDNSSYTVVTACSDGLNGTGQNRDAGASTMYFLDVTDTSQVKVKFSVSSLSSGSSMIGSTTFTSGAIFIRMGDT